MNAYTRMLTRYYVYLSWNSCSTFYFCTARDAPYAKARTHLSRDIQMSRPNNHGHSRTAAENGPSLLSWWHNHHLTIYSSQYVPPVLGLDLFENKSPVASSLIWPCRYFSTHDTAQCATLFSENLECQIESLISNQIPPSWGTKFPDMKNLVHCSNSFFPQSVKEMI